MLNNKVKVNRLNNEDVIATSAYTCETSPYHLFVVHQHDDDKEWCALYQSANGLIGPEYDTSDSLPSDISGFFTTHDDYFDIELSDAAEDDMYYFTGSRWAKCAKDYDGHSTGL